MSIQNNMIRPTFSKSVMGYTTGEVDKYVDHVSERYGSVCRENTELKRRVLSLTARLNEAEEKISELEKISVTKKVLDKSALSKVFDSLNEEKKRYVCFIDSLMEKLNSITADFAEDLPDDSWQTLLDEFLEEVPVPTEEEEKEVYDELSSDEGYIEDLSAVSVSEDAEAEKAVPETSEVMSDSKDETALGDTDEEDNSQNGHEKSITEDNDTTTPEEDNDSSEDTVQKKDETQNVHQVRKTPAELAAALDFYTDDTYVDGQSFDPMTIAAEFTAKKSKPSFEDLMRPMLNPDDQ